MLIVSYFISIMLYYADKVNNQLIASQILVPNVAVLIMVNRLSNHQFFLLIRFLLVESVLHFFGLAAFYLDKLSLVLHCLRLKDIIEHLLNGLKFGVVFDPESIKNGVELHFALEDVVVHAADAVHRRLELSILALLQEFKGVLLLGDFSLHFDYKFNGIYDSRGR